MVCMGSFHLFRSVYGSGGLHADVYFWGDNYVIQTNEDCWEAIITNCDYVIKGDLTIEQLGEKMGTKPIFRHEDLARKQLAQEPVVDQVATITIRYYYAKV